MTDTADVDTILEEGIARILGQVENPPRPASTIQPSLADVTSVAGIELDPEKVRDALSRQAAEHEQTQLAELARETLLREPDRFGLPASMVAQLEDHEAIALVLKADEKPELSQAQINDQTAAALAGIRNVPKPAAPRALTTLDQQAALAGGYTAYPGCAEAEGRPS